VTDQGYEVATNDSSTGIEEKRCVTEFTKAAYLHGFYAKRDSTFLGDLLITDEKYFKI
jgi:hypothetical protein